MYLSSWKIGLEWKYSILTFKILLLIDITNRLQLNLNM